jgi:glycosyltransferase involved in cell wall biosynthesis
LKILQINKYYCPKSGSDRYVFDVSAMLQSRGHTVIPFAMKHERNEQTDYSKYFVENIDYETVIKKGIFAKMHAFFKIIYSLEARNKLLKLITRENPDIAHVHKFSNTLTPSILYALKKKNIPVVQTLHDYRTVCPNYNMYDFNRFELCEDCKGHKYFNAVRRRCQKSSYLIGLNIALESYLYHFLNTYESTIDLFISPSNFLMKKMIEFGIDRNKVIHIPNFVDSNKYVPSYTNSNYILYFGRLERHKGIQTLIAAMKNVKASRLYIAGEGTLRNELEKYAKRNNIRNVTILGFITRKKLIELIRHSLLTVLPSEWYENCPMSILESFALGKPVIGANIGGIPDLVDNGYTGLLFEAGNVDDLTERINYLLDNKNLVAEMGRNARKRVEEKYDEKIHYERLMEAYNKVL